MSVSASEDEATHDRKNRELELDYKGESANYRKRAREHEKYLDNAHASPWGRFQITLRDRIEAQTGFEASIRNNPIKLLLAIKCHALDYGQSRAWISVVLDAFQEFFNCRQEEHKTLSDCAR